MRFDPMRARIPVLKRLWPSLLKRWADLTWAQGYALRSRHGGLFLLNYRNFVDRQIAFYGAFEADQIARLTRLIQDRGIGLFLDIGANIGLYSVAIGLTCPTVRIIAFEPDGRNRAQLHANLLLNRLTDRVAVIDKAVSARTGDVSFVEFSERSTGQSKVGDGPGSRSVAAVALDDLVPERSMGIALKIDIEGHELEAVAGMRRLLAENACVLQIESFEERAGRLAALMQELGYSEEAPIGSDRYFRPRE